MKRYVSGAHARELGLGKTGNLPSNPEMQYVFHGNVDAKALESLLGHPPTQADINQARRIARYKENQAVDEFFRAAYAQGAKKAKAQAEEELLQEKGKANDRMAGAALASAGGTAGLVALIQLLQSDKMETTQEDRR